MRVLDTNVILSVVLEEDPAMAADALVLVSSGQPMRLDQMVLAEVAWTMAERGYTKADVLSSFGGPSRTYQAWSTPDRRERRLTWSSAGLNGERSPGVRGHVWSWELADDGA